MTTPDAPDVSDALPKMQYVRLGNTGMKVSKIGLGCMSYGTPEWQKWVLEEEPSLDMIKRAYDAGINFFDTADVYSNGESEKILGKAIKKFNIPREQIVVATKVYAGFVEGQHDKVFFGKSPEDYGYTNISGLSRKHIFQAIDDSLRRLDLDYVDLYQIHRFDYNTPVEETMEALHDLVKSGKVRYIGASSMYAWQFAKMNHVAEKRGWTKFVSMQNLYNLVYREEEREMIPCCLDAGVSMIPWSPLARGALTRRVNQTTLRSESDNYMLSVTKEYGLIVDRLFEIAEKHKATPAQVALAWCWSKPVVAAPIIGISKPSHLKDLVKALNVKLTDEDCKYLEEPYVTRAISGHF